MTRHRSSRSRQTLGRAVKAIDTRTDAGTEQIAAALAEQEGVSVRTIYRWMNDARTDQAPVEEQRVDTIKLDKIDPNDRGERRNPTTGRITLNGYEMAEVISHAGQVLHAWETLRANGETTLSKSQFWRRFNNLEQDLRCGIKDGVHAQLATLPYTGWSTARPLEIIAIDHCNFGVKVIGADGVELDAWGTIGRELHHGMMTMPVPTFGIDMKGDPNSEATIEAILGIVTGFDIVHPDTGEIRHWGGIPEMVLMDNGGSNRSEAVISGLSGLGTKFHSGPAYESTYNGVAERAVQTVKNRMRGFPGSHKAPKGLRNVNHHADHALVLTPEQLAVLLEDIWYVHNFETVDPKTGLTPIEKFMASEYVPEQIDAAVIARMFRWSKTPQVRNGKIIVNGVEFWAPELGASDFHLRYVEAKYLKNDRTFVEIFDNDEWVCTATRVDEETLHTKGRVASSRRARARNLDVMFKAGSERSAKRAAERFGIDVPTPAQRRGEKTSPLVTAADINDLFNNTEEAS